MLSVSPGAKEIGVLGEIDMIENPGVVVVIDVIRSELGDVL